jgi:hypothetical protein
VDDDVDLDETRTAAKYRRRRRWELLDGKREKDQTEGHSHRRIIGGVQIHFPESRASPEVARVDPVRERLKNDDEANAMLSRPMRAPYAL